MHLAANGLIVVGREVVDDVGLIQHGLDRAALHIVGIVPHFLDALVHVLVVQLAELLQLLDQQGSPVVRLRLVCGGSILTRALPSRFEQKAAIQKPVDDVLVSPISLCGLRVGPRVVRITMVVVILGTITVVLRVLEGHLMDDSVVGALGVLFSINLRPIIRIIILVDQIGAVVAVRGRIVNLLLPLQFIRTLRSPKLPATIPMPPNLIRDENVVDIAIAIDFARIAVRHKITFASIYYKFEGLTHSNNKLRFEAFQNRVILAWNAHLPRLLWRKLAKHLNLRLRCQVHLLRAL